jgi:hypothetical protein
MSKVYFNLVSGIQLVLAFNVEATVAVATLDEFEFCIYVLALGAGCCYLFRRRSVAHLSRR